MSLSKLIGLDKIFGEAGEAIDKVFTNDEERGQLHNTLEELRGKLEVALQKEVSERWKADMASDSKLSKNVRPAMWIASGVWLAFIFSADTILIQNGMPGVKPQILETSAWAFSTISGMYVVSRELGKGVVNWKKK